MSGIYIPDIEVPTKCPCRLIGVGYDMYCYAVHGIPARAKEYDECCENGTKPSWCPILPSTEVQPVIHAHWIEQSPDFDLCGVAYYKCSRCGREQQQNSHYCQFCGVKMDEEGEDK